MKLTRKEFLKTAGVLTAGAVFQGNRLLSVLQQDNPGMKLIRDDVGIYQNRGGTIGWYISDDAVIIVDSQFPPEAKLFLEEIKKKTKHGADVLFNTHHHGDHTSGNSYLRDYVKDIVATDKCVELQKKFNSKDPASPPVTANKTFSKNWNEDAGKEHLRAFHYTNAHTGGDAVIHFQKANVVHVGDLVFNKIFPYMDGPGGCSINGWIEFLEKVAAVYSNDTAFIFGHAKTPEMATGSLIDVLNMRDYLNGLLDFVGKEIKNGKSKEDIAKAEFVPGFEDVTEGWKGSRAMNLNFAYDELTKS